MAKKKRLFFDSQQQASSMLQIPIERIRQAKRDGCPAFRSGRVYIAEFRSWLKKKQRCGDTETDPNAEERALRLSRDKLRLEREEFEFEQLKEKMVPISQVELLFSRTLPAFKAAVLALPPRINKRIEGLDYNGRMLVLDEEIRTMLKTLANPTYLHPIRSR